MNSNLTSPSTFNVANPSCLRIIQNQNDNQNYRPKRKSFINYFLPFSQNHLEKHKSNEYDSINKQQKNQNKKKQIFIQKNLLSQMSSINNTISNIPQHHSAQTIENRAVTLGDEIFLNQQKEEILNVSRKILQHNIFKQEENNKTIQSYHQSYQFLDKLKELFFIETIKKICQLNLKFSTYQKQIQQDDLPKLLNKDTAENYCLKYTFLNLFKKENHENYSFYSIFFWQQNKIFTIEMIVYGLIESNSNFFISLQVFNLIQDFKSNDELNLYLNALYLSILTFISILSKTYRYIQLSKFGSQMRQILIFILMGKVSTLTNSSMQQSKSGSVLNLMSSDLSYIDSQHVYVYSIPIVPVSLIVSGWILWDKFEGVYGLIVLLICILTYPTQITIQHFVQQKLSKLKASQDLRIKQQSNFFQNIQTIKMYCWQDILQQMILDTRKIEWKYYIQIQLLQLIEKSITQSINIWGSFLFLAIIYNLEVELTLEKIILTIQMMGTIRYYCVYQVSQGLKALVTLNIIFNRIKRFLMTQPLFAENIEQTQQKPTQNFQTNFEFVSNKEISQFSLIQIDKEKTTNQAKPQLQSQQSIQLYENIIQIKSVNCFWNKEQQPVLKKLNISITSGQLLSVIGKTGSGKTSFLQLILKEIPFINGTLDIAENTTIRYVDQDPFINPTSIKENIIFGKEFDEELFLEVIHATNIFSDIMLFPNKENTKIGENGATLSGGQKARLSLARALYSMPDVYLLDDPLSAVDSKVAKHIFTQAIQNFIFKYQVKRLDKNPPIVIMTTHQLSFALKFDTILVIDDGQIIFSGNPQEVSSQIEKILNVTAAETNDDEQEQGFQRSNKKRETLQLKEVIEKENSNMQVQKESIFKVFKLFLHYFSCYSFCTVVILNLLTEGIRNIFFRILTASVSKEGLEDYLIILLILIIGNILNNIMKYFICSSSILKSNNLILSQTMKKLANAKKSYLDTQSSGLIMSKYTTDFAIIDSQMPMILIDILEDGIQFIVSLFMIAIFQPFFILPIFITLFLSYYLFRKVTPVLSQLKLNDLQKRAPLLQHIKTYLQGLTHFRISEQFQNQKEKFFILANESFQSNYFYHQTQKCFSMYVDLIALFAKTSGIFLIIIFIKDEALFSQALLLLQSFHSQNTLLRQLMEFNGLLNSYSRLFNLLKIDTEQIDKKELPLPHAWPKQGSISVKNLTLFYDPKKQPVLRQISFQIKAGEKVAFIGRTGAGKSSIINALYNLLDYNEDGQILIDECNVRNLTLNQLRSSLTIIPQQPFLFHGTIKQNLDPKNNYTEQDIWKALSDVGMDELVEQQEQFLETNIAAINLSAGQKQLLCLARAILSKRKIVILDEASANMDLVTDQQIQEIIKQKFIDCTIIAIAHRINTISHYDKVFVLENGKIIEVGVPFHLLSDDLSNTEINLNTHFAKIVKETGKKNAQNIFEIAKETLIISQMRQKGFKERLY